jgi:phage internal scaffolding protein
MSKKYAEQYPEEVNPSKTSVQMRAHVSRPGRFDKDGNPIYVTEQSHKDKCDITKILNRYQRTGLIDHVSNFEAEFGEMTGIQFKEMMDKILNAQNSFDGLPSHIRNEFKNSPQKLLEFMEDSNNREKAIELGLISPSWTTDSDGLGEHVPKGQNKNKPDEGPSE